MISFGEKKKIEIFSSLLSIVVFEVRWGITGQPSRNDGVSFIYIGRNVPANTCQASADLATRLRMIYIRSP